VEDFVEFLTVREMRSAAGARLDKLLTKLDALNLPTLSDDEINAELQAVRQYDRKDFR